MPHCASGLCYAPGMRAPESILEDALQLPEEERAKLVLRLSQSLPTNEVLENEEELDQAWAEEIARRVQSIQDGTATTVPADEALQRAHAALDRIRD